MTSVMLLTDRPAFASLWGAACTRVGLAAQAQVPERSERGLQRGQAIVVDAEHPHYTRDTLLAQVGFARAHGTVIAVALPEDERFVDREPLLLELCGGLVARAESDVGRVTFALKQRCETGRNARFEFLAPAPGGRDLLAILGDGTVALVDPPDRIESDHSGEIEAITLADDRRSAQVCWRDGVSVDLIAAELATTSRQAGPLASNGAAGLHDVDGVRLGQRLRALRIAAGLTQAELARRTGIHRPNIARVEAGRHTPSLETLARLAAAIGVSTTRVLAD